LSQYNPRVAAATALERRKFFDECVSGIKLKSEEAGKAWRGHGSTVPLHVGAQERELRFATL
jgi:hypothetical protein